MNKFITCAHDIVTTYNETKLGFLAIALRKSKEATYYISLAKAFRSEIEDYEDPLNLLNNDDIIGSLCDAAGISNKAKKYLNLDDSRDLLNDFLEEYIVPLGSSYIDDLVGRYLLTQGDALGGRMRNIVGTLANEKLTQGIVSNLKIRDCPFYYLDKNSKKWVIGNKLGNDSINLVKAIRWKKNEISRMLIYDLTVPIVKKNIDIVVFNNDELSCISKKEEQSRYLNNPHNYLTLGELKGGIDPAGADEHWKTANTALNRIRSAFSSVNHSVNTIFIGAAIEAAMAQEIYDQLISKTLSNCANLTKDNQFQEACKWLVKS